MVRVKNHINRQIVHYTATLIGGLFLALWFALILPFVATKFISEQYVPVFVRAPSANAAGLFSDDFNRANSATVGNGWVESESTGTIEISSDKLFFNQTNNIIDFPVVDRSFVKQTTGTIEFIYTMDWALSGVEGTYSLYMQIGDSASMVAPSSNRHTGIAASLRWYGAGCIVGDECLQYRTGGAYTDIQVVNTAMAIKMTMNLDTNTYSVDVGNNGSYEVVDVAFTGNYDIDSVRFFTNALDDVNFSGRTFDNVTVRISGSGAPTITSITETLTSGTSHVFNLPATVDPNDLLLAIFAVDGSTGGITQPGGWTKVGENANSNTSLSVFALKAVGNEDGGTATATTGASKPAVTHVLRILASEWSQTIAGIEGTFAALGTTPIDPPSHTATGGLADYLWIAGGNAQTGLATVAPTNYTNLQTAETGTTTSDAHLSWARRALTASSEDPGTFTGTFATQIATFTVLIPPSSGGFSFGTPVFNDNNDGNSTTLALTKPSGVVDGDVMLTFLVSTDDTTNSHTTLSGWTLIGSRAHAVSDNVLMSAYYKVAGASEPSSYTWTQNNNTRFAGVVVKVTGVDSSDVVDVISFTSDNTWDSNIVAPSVTATDDNGLLVTFLGFSGSSGVTSPGGHTELSDFYSDGGSDGGRGGGVGYETLTASGSTGIRTWTRDNTSPDRDGVASFILNGVGGGSGTIWSDDFSTDKLWTGYGGLGEWERLAATASICSEGPTEDPASDYSPSGDDYVLGNDIGGCYANGISTTQWITSPVIDASGYSSVNLSFWRWLGIERDPYDFAYVEVYDGGTWQQVWVNSTSDIADSSWTQQTFDVSSYANANFQIRFGIYSDGGWVAQGWNIDDVLLEGTAPCSICKVQEATNYDAGWVSSGTVTLGTGATSGNLIVTAIAHDKDAGTVSAPSGFTMIQTGKSGISVTGSLAYKVSTGGETAIQWTWTTAKPYTVWAAEYSGLDSSSPLDVSQKNDSADVVVTSLATGTTASTTQADELAIAMVAIDTLSNADGGSAWSDGFSALVLEPAGTSEPGLGVAQKILSSTGTVSTTYSTTDPGDQMYAAVATFKPAVPCTGICRVQSATDVASATPSATFSQTPVEGNLLVAMSAHRQEGTTPSIGAGWTLVINDCYALSSGTCGTVDFNHRRALAVWYKIAGASEPTNIQTSWNDGSVNGLIIQEFEDTGGGVFTYDTQTSSDSATLAVSSQTSGTTAQSAQADSLLVTAMMSRGLTGAAGWTNGVSDNIYFDATGGGSTIGMNTGFGVDAVQSTKESAGSWGAAQKATVGILVFSLGPAGPPTVTTNAATHITPSSGRLHGSVTASGSTNAYFRYWTSNPASCSAGGYTQTANQNFSSPSGQVFSEDIALSEAQGYWYCAFADNGTAASGAELNFTAGTVGWYAAGGTWNYRKKITIDNTRVINSNQLQFPVLVDITGDTDLQARLGQTDGGDIVFTGPDGTTKLDHEVELVNKTAGDLVVWVEVDKATGDAFELLNSVDTVLYMYYGDVTVADQWNVAGTWNSNYIAVWHLGADENDSAGLNNGTNNGSVNATGRIGDGQSFDGNDSIDLGNAKFDEPSVTVCAWINTSFDHTLDARIITTGSENTNVWHMSVTPEDWMVVTNTSASHATQRTDATINDGAWHYICGWTNPETIYRDSALQSSTKTDSWTFEVNAKIGTRGTARYFNGLIDEIRISNTARSVDWIATEYNSQIHDTTAFYTLGAEVSNNASPLIIGTGCAGPAAFSDSPDPQTVGSDTTFCADFNDADGDAVKLQVCKTNEIIPSGTGGSCTNGTWTSSGTAATTPDPRSETYMTQAADVGTSPNTYYVFVCDVNSACSGTSGNSGTFSVNAAPPIVTTSAATHITPSSGRLHGSVTASGGSVNIVQVQQNSANSGGADSTTATATLSVGATTGNLLVTALAVDKDAGTVSAPSGFTMIQTGKSTPGTTGGLAYKVAAGGETTIQWSYTTSEQNSVWAAEYSGINSSNPLDVSQENDSAGVSVVSISTGTTVSTTQADELSIAMVAVDSWDGMELGRSWTQSFTELVYEYDVGAASPGLGVASKTLTSTGAVETTVSTTSAGDQLYAAIATFKALGSSTSAYFRYWTSNPASCSAGGYTQTSAQSFSNPSNQAFSEDIALAEGQSYWYCAFADNGTASSGVEQTFTAGSVGWYATGGTWRYRKKITIDNTKVTNSNQLQFPVLVDISGDTDLASNVAQTDGGDILFTGPDGTTKLDHEIELFTPANADLLAWVEVTKTTGDAFELLNSVDTVLYIYYGNTAGGLNEQNVAGTWNSNYVAVWHLGEDCADGVVGCVADSTGKIPLTARGFSTGGDQNAVGKIGRADQFDGVDSFNDLDTPDASQAVGTDYSLFAWVNPDNLSDDYGVFTSTYNTDIHLQVEPTGNIHAFAYKANNASWPSYDCESGGGEVSASTWTSIGYTVNGTTVKIYDNGSEVSSYGGCTVIGSPTDAGISTGRGIGLLRDYSMPSWVFDGIIDEVRFVDSVLSDDWIQTEYNNQNNPSNGAWYILGAEETQGPSATTSAADNITATTADLHGLVNPNGNATNGWFRYVADTSPGTCNDTFGTATTPQAMGSGGVDVNLDQSIATLTKNTTYYFCAIAEDINTTKAFGSVMQFTTTADAPTEVITDPAASVQAYSAFLWGKANPNGATTTAYFRYNTADPVNCIDVASGGGTNWGTRAPAVGGVNIGSGSTQTSFSQSISGLLQNTTYYFCSFAGNSGGTTHAGTDVESFTTLISLNDAPVIGSVLVTPEPSRSGSNRVLSWDDRYTSLNGLSTGTSLDIDTAACDVSDNVYIVQYKDAAKGSNGTADIGLTLSSTPAQNNLLVAVVSSSDDGEDITGPAGWTQAVEQAYNIRVRVEIWYRVAGASEPTAITFTQASASSAKVLAIYEVAGMATSGTLDRTQGENSNANSISMIPGPTALTSQANELAFVSIVSDNEQDGQGWSRDFTNGFTYSTDIMTGGGGDEAATIIALKLLSEIEAVETATSWDAWSEQASVIATFKADISTCSTATVAEEIRIAYYDETASAVDTAVYVGDLSGSCLNTDWDCDTIAASGGDHGEGVQLKYDASGDAWVAYQFVPTAANATLMVAQYVGSGGTCATNYGGSAEWNCTIVDDPAGSVGITADLYAGGIGISFDSSDNPWVSYYDVTNTDLKVARFVGGGSGSGCGSGSSDWICESVDGTGSDMGESWNTIARDGSDAMWVAYRNNNDTSLKVAKYVGGGNGSGCSDADWTCEILDNGGDDGDLSSMAIHPGTGFPWVSYKRESVGELKIAKYTGTGSESSCAGGSSNWTCEVIDTVTGGLGKNTSIEFNSTGNAWVAAYDDGAAPDVMFVAQYVGNGGSCSNTAWDCTTIFSTTSIGGYPSIDVDSNDVPWFSYYDNESVFSAKADEIQVAKFVGGGGTGCEDSTAWTCTTVASANTAGGNIYTSMAIRTGTTASSSAITYIQEANGQADDPGSTTVSATYSSMPTAGNMLIAVHTQDDGGETTLPAGWSLAGSKQRSNSLRYTIAYKVADASDQGPWTFTIVNPETQVLSIFEYSGIATTYPVDRFFATSISGGGTTSADPTTWISTDVDNELLLGVIALNRDSDGWNNAWTNSFTVKSTVSATGVEPVSQSIADRIVSSKGTYTTNETWTTGAYATEMMVSFRAASETWTQSTMRGYSTEEGGNVDVTQIDISIPTNTQSGDVMVAFTVADASSDGAWSGPAGWTNELEFHNSVEQTDLAAFYKVATGSEPSSYTFTYSVSGRLAGGITSYYDIDTTGSPIDVSASFDDTTWDNDGIAPSVTTTQANTLYVAGWGHDSGSGFSGFPSSMAGRYQSKSTSNSMASADEVRPSAGATGTRTATIGINRSVGIALALKCVDDCQETITPSSGAVCDPATWYDCDWQYRQKITIDYAQVGEGKLTLPGLTTDYVSTPDKAALDITGDIDIRFKFAPADWTPALNEAIVAKWNPNSDDPSTESWIVYYSPNGRLLMLYWKESDGTIQLGSMSLADEDFPPNDGSSLTARITLDVDNGGQWRLDGYLSSDDGATWDGPFDTETGASGVSSIYASTHDLYIGRAEEAGVDRFFTGDVYWVEIYDGINGTLVANPNFTNTDQGDWSLGSGTDTSGNSWTINGSNWTYNAPSDMTNFPLYLDLAQLGSQFFAGVNSDGGDIRVTTSDGKAEIGREIVSTDTTGETGEVYFLAPTISASSDTDFYVYYGNDTASDYATTATYGRNLVWTTAGYVGVWHLEEVCSDGASGCIIDSTGQNNATATNFQDGGGGTTDAVGKIGGGVLWETGAGADDYIEFPAHASRIVGTTYSVFAWAKPAGVSSWNSAHSIFSSRYQPDLSFRGDDSSGPTGLRGLAYEANSPLWDNYDCDDSIVIWKEGEWDYVGMTVNGTDVRVYENSSRRPNQNGGGSDCTLASAPVGTDTGLGYIGAFRTSSLLYPWEGTLDEVRFSDNALSEEWLHTEYNGQSDSTTFATYGGSESSMSSGGLTSGTLTSLTLDTRSPNGVGMNSFMWRGTKPAGTSARFWIATSECPNGETNPPDCTTPRDPGIYETFTGTDFDFWDNGAWTSSILNGGAVDIRGNWGRLSNTATADSTARVSSTMAPIDDSEVLVRFNNNNGNFPASNNRSFRMFLRASDDWDGTNTANPTSGYAVEFDTPTNRFRLYRVNGGVLTQIGSDYISTTTDEQDHQFLRFRVEGNQIKLRTWRYFTDEPTAWQIEATDSSVTGSGVLQMSLTASGAANVGDFTLDDLYVSNPAVGAAGSESVGNQWDYRGASCSIDGTPYAPEPGTVIDIGCDNENYNARYFRYKVQLCSTVNCLVAGQFTPDVQDIIVNWSR